MAAIATSRLDMCQTPQQTAEVNGFDCLTRPTSNGLTTGGVGGHGPGSQKSQLAMATMVEKKVRARMFI